MGKLGLKHGENSNKMADYIIDIGLEGGKRGGTIVVDGSPEEVANHKTSHTARYLKSELVLES